MGGVFNKRHKVIWLYPLIDRMARKHLKYIGIQKVTWEEKGKADKYPYKYKISKKVIITLIHKLDWSDLVLYLNFKFIF